MGTAEQVTENLKRYRDAGLTMPLLWPPFSGTPTAKTIGDMRRLVHDILPKPAPAFAASPIVTPAVTNSATATLTCWVVNASATKTLEVAVEIRSFSGTVLESGDGEVVPLGANALSTTNSQARFCVVNVLRGGKKNAVVSLVALEGGSPVAVVQANR